MDEGGEEGEIWQIKKGVRGGEKGKLVAVSGGCLSGGSHRG